MKQKRQRPEDVRAAEEYSYYKDKQKAFLAGCEHKLNVIDELINHIEKLNKSIDDYWNDSSKPDSKIKAICEVQKESFKLIQKYAK